MRIALVDDEMLIVEGLKKIIGRKYPDMEIEPFTDPALALEGLQNRLPDLLITDIRMPGMTGLELIARFREKGLRYYAVLTGLDDVPLLQESIRLRVSDYLIKPVNKEELFSLIERTRQQLDQEKKSGSMTLAEVFRAASQSDEEIYMNLKSQMERSDSPVETLDQFIRTAGREMPFWQVCQLAEEMEADGCAPKEIMSRLRALPLEKTVSSPEVRQVVLEMKDAYARDITLAGMANKVFLQPNYFTTLFHKEMGMGFVQYLNQLRIDAACRKIVKEPGLPLQDVGQACGFPSTRYFFSTFKKYTGVTPGTFRDAWTKRP